MPCNHLILCCALNLLPSIFPSIRGFSNESVLHIRWPKYWSFSFTISPSNEYSGPISFRMDWLDLLAFQGTLKSLLYEKIWVSESKNSKSASDFSASPDYWVCLFFLKKILIIDFGCTRSSLLHVGFLSSCGEQGLLSSRGMRISYCNGFSCFAGKSLGARASEAVALRL